MSTKGIDMRSDHFFTQPVIILHGTQVQLFTLWIARRLSPFWEAQRDGKETGLCLCSLGEGTGYMWHEFWTPFSPILYPQKKMLTPSTSQQAVCCCALGLCNVFCCFNISKCSCKHCTGSDHLPRYLFYFQMPQISWWLSFKCVQGMPFLVCCIGFS